MALFPRTVRRSLALVLAGLVATTPPAQALLNFDGTRNQLYVFGGVTYNYSSNIYAQADGPGDSSISVQAGTELKRKAGLIAVDFTAKVDFVRYQDYDDENSINPNFSLVFTKGTGRTTGSLSLAAYRETRSDSAVNLRTSTLNFPVALNVRYPIDEKFYLTSATEYARRNYEDNDALVDYTDFSEALDFYYTYSSKLDLLAGYRLRLSETSVYGRATDHWFNVGATGGLLAKLTGTVRVGYQLRNVESGSPDHFDNFNFLAGLNWPVLAKLSVAFNASRDFGTIATGEMVDTSALTLRATYSYSRKLQFNTGVSAGRNDFLGDTQDNRRDTYFSWDAGFVYQMNEHFQFGGSYIYFRNWSSLPIGDYENHGVSLNVSGRY
jgi:hypothetical protein